MFFSCRGAKRGWAGVPASASLQAKAGGPVQADHSSLFFGDKVNVCRCHVNVCWYHEFRSSSKNKVRHCENLLVKFKPIFGHLDLVQWTSLLKTVIKYSKWSNQKLLHFPQNDFGKGAKFFSKIDKNNFHFLQWFAKKKKNSSNFSFSFSH